MQPSGNRHRKHTTRVSLILVIVLFLAVLGCKKDSSPTGPSGQAYPTVAGHWVGNGSYDMGQAGKNEWSIAGDITQAADSLSPVLTWSPVPIRVPHWRYPWQGRSPPPG